MQTQEVDAMPTPGSSQSSATRVGDRTPTPSVLGISTSTDILTAEQYEQLEQVINGAQSILQKQALTQQQLDKLSQILRGLLLIINTEDLLLEV